MYNDDTDSSGSKSLSSFRNDSERTLNISILDQLNLNKITEISNEKPEKPTTTTSNANNVNNNNTVPMNKPATNLINAKPIAKQTSNEQDEQSQNNDSSINDNKKKQATQSTPSTTPNSIKKNVGSDNTATINTNNNNNTDNTIVLSAESLEQIRMKAASMSLPMLAALCSDQSLIRSLSKSKREGSF